jgi:hypothetical protein
MLEVAMSASNPIPHPIVDTHDDDAAAARIIEDRRRLSICSEIEELIAEVSDQHPDLPIFNLTPYLSEPERTRLLALLVVAQDFITYPI